MKPLGRLIDVGTHRLHMTEEGKEHAGPTVVLDHGCGGGALSWSGIFEEVQQFARVVAYDRAGYGLSDCGPLPRTAYQCTFELHQMLKKANIPAPYILVGHSSGALHVRLFASMYPELTAGVVLVDAIHEDEETRRFPIEHHRAQRLMEKTYATLALLAKAKLPAMLAKNQKLPKISGLLHRFPVAVQDRFWHLFFQKNALEAAYDEFRNLSSGYTMIRDHQELGSIPLLVLRPDIVTEFAPLTPEEQKWRIRCLLHEVAEELAQFSSRGRVIVGEKSEFSVQMEEPQLVIEAIQELHTLCKQETAMTS